MKMGGGFFLFRCSSNNQTHKHANTNPLSNNLFGDFVHFDAPSVVRPFSPRLPVVRCLLKPKVVMAGRTMATSPATPKQLELLHKFNVELE